MFSRITVWSILPNMLLAIGLFNLYTNLNQPININNLSLYKSQLVISLYGYTYIQWLKRETCRHLTAAIHTVKRFSRFSLFYTHFVLQHFDWYVLCRYNCGSICLIKVSN